MTNTSGLSQASDKDTDQAGLPDTRLAGERGSIGDLLGMPGIEDIEIDIPVQKDLGRPADLS